MGNLLQKLNYHLIFKTLLVISLFISQNACHQKKGSNSSQENKTRSISDLRKMSQKMPVQTPTICVKMIRDSARNDFELSKICRNVINRGWDQKPDIFFELLDKIDSLAGRENDSLHTIILGERGRMYLRVQKNEKALLLLQESLQLSQIIGDSLLISNAFRLLGTYYTYIGKVSQSFLYLKKSLNYCPPQKKEDLGHLMMDLAVNHYRQNSLSKATEYAQKSVNLIKDNKDSSLIGLYTNYLSVFYAENMQADSALYTAQSAYKMMNAIADTNFIMQVYYNLAFAYKLKKDYAQSLYYAEKVAKHAEVSQKWERKTKIMRNMGNCYMLMGNPQKAKEIYQEIRDLSNAKFKHDLNTALCDSLVAINLIKTGDADLLQYFRRNRKYQDSVEESNRNNILNELSVKYESEEKEQKIQNLIAEKQGFKTKLLIALCICIIICSILMWFLYLSRKSSVLIEQENTVLMYKHRLQELEISANKQQLVLTSEHIIAKNKLINEMEARLNILIENHSQNQHLQKESIKEEFSNIKILTEDDWDSYLRHFEKSFPSFLGRIFKEFPNLTQGELRLFILIKVGFSKNEILSILGISKEGVRKAQQRLRKRLGLEETDNLEEFIINFAENK